MSPTTPRTKTGDIKLPDAPEPLHAGELSDDRLVPGRLESLMREVRELVGVLRTQVLPAINDLAERQSMIDLDRNELFQRVSAIEAKLANVG